MSFMKKGDWYKLFLFILFIGFWIWAAINPAYPDDWLLENYLVFIFVPLILIFGYYFKLSNLSYTLITIFMVLHVIGAHYTYSEVPFGYVLQDWFNANRNMFDRLVHFSFGLFLAYPMREILMRLGRLKGIWAYYFPIDFVLAGSVIYELIEWGSAAIVDPQAGLAFLGTQGDIWDAQKDMLMAGLGSICAMLITLFVNLGLNDNLGREIRESLKIPEGDKPLGEIKIMEFLNRNKNKRNIKKYKVKRYNAQRDKIKEI